ncbi:glycoside hydrolase family 3 protein [Atractiella rhizophila]|nr:glycoside hydrolase family 3 protein [Atractiella rhizophila]
MKGSLAVRVVFLALSFQNVALSQVQNLTGPGWNTVPPPLANGGSHWAAAFTRAKKIVDQMTIEEKVRIVTGQDGLCGGNVGNVSRVGFPGLCLADGPAGPRPAKEGVTQLPAGVTTAATWNQDLIYQRAVVIGQEFADLGVNVALGPVTGGPLGRAPRAGRNWEGWSTDPYASGVASYLSVKGMKEHGVIITAKHYIAYEQETFRRYYAANPASFNSSQLSISANLDDRTMHEVYLWSFAEAVRAGADFNQTRSCANSMTINGLLKTELNFQGKLDYSVPGAVMSDWGGVYEDTNGAFEMGGTDLIMPGNGFFGILGTFWNDTLVEQVKNGTVPESRLTDMVLRIVTPFYASGQADKKLPSPVYTQGVYTNVQKPSSVTLAKTIAEESLTLLKNVNGALPLRAPQTLAIIGEDSGPNILGTCGDTAMSCPINNNNGTITMGGGSGYAYPKNLITPLQALQSRAAELGTLVQFVLNDTAFDSISSAAATSEVAIVFLSAWAQEFQDRTDLDVRNAIVNATASVNNNTIVVLHIPGPVLIEEWVEHPNVTAIIAAYYPGEQAGPSLTSVLYGDISPSGKLPFTLGKRSQDWPPNNLVTEESDTPQANFTEGLNFDYKWFDSQNIEPRYEFGFGLSYTSFKYSNIQIYKTFKRDTTTIARTAEPFDGTSSLYDIIAVVQASVKNTGNIVASEVAFLFLEFAPEEEEPPRNLRGFTKLSNISPGASKTAIFDLRRKDVSVWDVVLQRWRLPKGKVTMHVGQSSRILPLNTQTTF